MSIMVIQLMGVLYFLMAIRFKVWKTSLNTFLVFATAFTIVATREIEFLRTIWVDYHLTLIATLLTFMMVRVVIQGAHKKKEDNCSSCWDFLKECKWN